MDALFSKWEKEEEEEAEGREEEENTIVNLLFDQFIRQGPSIKLLLFHCFYSLLRSCTSDTG
jgi:hypothetical protein